MNELTQPVESKQQYRWWWLLSLSVAVVAVAGGVAVLVHRRPTTPQAAEAPASLAQSKESAQESSTPGVAESTSPPSAPAQSTPSADRWRPQPGLSFQWQLADPPVNTTVIADVYEIDGLDSPKSVVDELHAQGRKVVCYVDVGSWEDFRADKDQFPAAVIGEVYQGYPNERWLDIRQLGQLAPVLGKRFDTCRDKGFDAIEGDNVDGFEQDSGFPLSADDQLRFNRWVASEAHARGLAAALKNDSAQVGALVGDFDFVVTESCVEQRNCDDYAPFRSADKLHVDAEYTDTAVTKATMCTEAKRSNLTAVLKHRTLDAYRVSCDE